MYCVGIDLGGTNIAAGLTNELGEILCKVSTPTIRERSNDEIIRDMAKVAKDVIEKSGVNISDVKWVGIGSPGIIDYNNGVVVYNCNLNFNNLSIRKEMNKYIDLPIFIENDANCAAWAEAECGAAKGTKSSITITLGTGVGGGIIVDRKILNGFNYAGGEPGHVVIEVNGELCECGRKGCWEAYSSATALIRDTKIAYQLNPSSLMGEIISNDISNIDARTSFLAAKKGDKTAKKVVDKYILYLAEGITNMINVFQPEVLVIGGGISNEGENLLVPLREKVSGSVYSRNGIPHTKLAKAIFGNDAGIIGAALLGKLQ